MVASSEPRERHSRKKAGSPGYLTGKATRDLDGQQPALDDDDDGDHPIWRQQSEDDKAEGKVKLLTLRDAFKRARGAHGSAIRAAAEVVVLDPLRDWKKVVPGRGHTDPPRPILDFTRFARLIRFATGHLVLLALLSMLLGLIDTVDDAVVSGAPKTLGQRVGLAPPCDCTERPCRYDPTCGALSDPLGGLGCNAEGEALCRYELLSCEPGAAKFDSPCFDSSLCRWMGGGLGCNATGVLRLRFCGFGPYESIECPRNAKPSKATDRGVPKGATWEWV